MTKRLVVLISGSGTNLQAILDAIQTGELAARVELVVSNHKNAFGLTRANGAGLPTLYFPRKAYKADRTAYDLALAERIAAYQPDLVVLAGWLHVFTAAFLAQFPNRVINLHPALPGTFAGLGAIEQAYAAYERGEIRESGCMVHYAVPEVDAGPTIAQTIVPFVTGDTLESFAERIHAAEHQLIVEAIKKASPV